MRNWYISFPVWGDDYRETFLERAYPTIIHALNVLPDEIIRRIIIVIHADEPTWFTPATLLFPHCQVIHCLVSDKRLLPYPASFGAFTDAHAETMNMAADGDWVSCLNADLAVSANFFLRLAQHATQGALAVTAMGLRTTIDGVPPPNPGMTPRELLKWGWANRHQIIRDLEWGTGTSDVSNPLFWSNEKSVVGHAHQLHPILVVKQPGIEFKESVDAETIGKMDWSRVHVVDQPGDLSYVEMSPASKRQTLRAGGDLMTTDSVAARLAGWAGPGALYRWQLAKRIVLVGTGDGIDEWSVINEILNKMGPPA